MKKTNRRMKRNIRWDRLAVIMFVLTGAAYLACSLFLRSYNNNLSAKKQEIDSQIATLETQNAAIRVDINTLSTSERVMRMTEGTGLKMDQNNIITIYAGNSGE
ncbi:MAG: hypothetical protein IKS37_09475 [Solobacterium sp.]|jgi:cell division protein FtsL|nr:hypothetical protein [Solobacterium sp.]